MRHLDIFFACAGGYIAVMSGMALVGHAGQAAHIQWLTNWNGAVPMALNTATCFFVVGWSFLALGRFLNLYFRRKAQ